MSSMLKDALYICNKSVIYNSISDNNYYKKKIIKLYIYISRDSEIPHKCLKDWRQHAIDLRQSEGS